VPDVKLVSPYPIIGCAGVYCSFFYKVRICLIYKHINLLVAVADTYIEQTPIIWCRVFSCFMPLSAEAPYPILWIPVEHVTVAAFLVICSRYPAVKLSAPCYYVIFFYLFFLFFTYLIQVHWSIAVFVFAVDTPARGEHAAYPKPDNSADQYSQNKHSNHDNSPF